MKPFTLKSRMRLFTSLIVFLAFPLIGFAQVDVPKILITPNLYDFGTLTVGQTRALQVTIKNRGEGTLSLLQIGDIKSSSEAYVLSEHCTNQSLAPNKLCRLNVTFQPQSDGIQNATLSIHSNDPATPVLSMSLKGKAILIIPKIVVSSMADYQFGAIDVNRTQDLWIRIANTGNGPLQIGEIVSSTDDYFLKTPNCADQTVAPDNECKMIVTFKPQSDGIRNAMLSIASNDPETPLLKVSLKGEGIPLTHKISVLSKTLDFGLQAIDSTTTENFRITSKGTGNLQLGQIQVSSTDFRLDTTSCANKTMLSGRDCFVPITFHPQSGGAKNAILSISSDDPEMPVLKVSLTGEGKVLIPNIAINSSDYDFGDINVGNTKSFYLEIENRGDGDLKIGQLKLASQAAFSLSHDNCTNSSLAASQACTVLMSFQPKSGGTKTASFSIPSNDPDQPSVTVSLKGNAFAAPKMVINQTAYQFGIVKVGSTSAASTLIIQNTGNDDLQISAITILGEYDLMQSCANKTLSPQGQCTLIVAFKPQSEGVLPGSLSIASNDPDTPNLRVSLSGEGRELMSPAIEITPTAIQFEDIQYGKTSVAQTITVKNVGKGPLSIKGMGFTDGHRYDFSFVGWVERSETHRSASCAYQTLAPSSSCTVQLQFQPTAIGPRTAKFYLLSDDPDTPTASISLAGNGNTPDGLACPTTPTIQSVQSGPWNSPSTWDQNRLPNADDIVGIHPNHTLLAEAPYYQQQWHNRIQIKGLCHHGVIQHGYQTWWYRWAGSRYRDGYGYLSLQASAFIYNYGQILGNTGYSGYYYGGQGGSLYLSTQGPFYNAPEATIRGGQGHRNQEYAGDGGHVEIHGHHTTNLGTLCAGNGSPTGHGGNLTVTGNHGEPGILRNEGLLCGGEGQKGSVVSIQSRPLVMLNGGSLRTSKQGQIWIGSDIILANKATEISGGQITFSGGDNVVLDLSRFAANAISASNLITLAVGNGGVIDFKASGDPVLKAPEVKLQTDRVLLPDGKSLTDRIDTPHLIMAVAKTLRKVSLNTPAAFAAEPGETLPIFLTIVNHGPKRETYQFSVTDTAGWVLGSLPSTLRLDGLQTRTMLFKVTLPATSAENTITINVLSQNDSEIRDSITVRVAASTEQVIDDGRQHHENDTPFDGHYTDESEHQGENDDTASDETTGEADNPPTGNIPSYLVSGNIRDKFNNPLPDVTVQVGEQSTLTNEQGEWQIGNLAEGDYTVTASQTGYRFQAQNVTVGNQENATVSFKPTSLLNIKVVSQPKVPEQGENITYTITVSNQGLETATNLILTEVLPENTNLITMETVNGHCESSTLICILGDLGPSEETTVEIVVSNQETEKLINTVQITANEYPADIKTTWTEIRPYLSVIVRDDHDPIAITETLKYSIETTLNDKAPTKATEVELEITLPNGVELQAINTDYGNCDLSQRPILICSLSDLGDIDNIRQIPVHIEVRLKDAGLLLLTLSAQITAKEYPIHTDRERTELLIGDIEVDFALLLDVTASMQTEIAELLEAVKRSEAWVKGELVLITFRDEVTVKALTQDINVLQTALEQLEAKGGGSCPEASIEALQVAISHVKPGGTIFLITDASPYPDANIESVIEQLLSKGIRLHAQITGDCSIESSWN
ncbi:MAG: choice-of-anchor D domain-containing protein [Candidatus Parabeggiatoa sp.]|nr:choice-of-anchor D domain-containing protein [Candidatus Parabeggiatoa sp.]